jgi:hypothetical protein
MNQLSLDRSARRSAAQIVLSHQSECTLMQDGEPFFLFWL